jgi:hypothetical protein
VIALTETIDYVYMLLVAAGVGAIGGLGAELVLARTEGTGILSLPGSTKDKTLWRLGFPASLIVGAIAAVAVLYFFPPVIEKVVTGANGSPETASQYDLAKLVPLALIVGSAGPAFLTAAQSGLMSALNAQKAGATADSAKAVVTQVADSAALAARGAAEAAVARHIPGASAQDIAEIGLEASETLRSTLAPQVEGAHKQVDAITPTAEEPNPPSDERPSGPGWLPPSER